MNKVTSKPKKRIFYFDALRALAIISVIIIHTYVRTQNFVIADYSSDPTLNWILCDFMGNFFRMGVDLFFILSGALSLGYEWDIKSFLRKRLPRITIPFLFWSITLCCILILIQYFIPSWFGMSNTVSINSISNLFIKAFTSKSLFIPYWFFWTILGIYLIMPIFNKWLLHSDLKEVEYFLVFWLITCLFDYTLMTPFPIKLSYFTSPIGFVVLGYYLRHTKRKLFNNLHLPILLIILMILLEMTFSYSFSSTEHIYNFDKYSILITFQAIGVFLLFKNLDEKKVFSKIPNKITSIFKKSITSIAKYSYGMYLTSNVIQFLVKSFLIKVNLYNLFKLDSIILFATGLFVSWAIMVLLNRVKYINKLIGAK